MKATQLSFICRLCGEVIEDPYCVDDLGTQGFKILGPNTFHPACFDIAVKRLSKFMDILCLPEKEWLEFLNDEDEGSKR